MQHLQRYLFLQLLVPLAVASAALAGLAILTQTLAQLSLLVDEGETFLLVLKIVLLTLPQLLAIVLPVALFIAVVQGLHRMHMDSELVVISTAGLSRWGVLSPVLRLTVCVMAAHLAIGLWLQPISHREMRRTMHDARVELAASLFQPGEFTQPADDLTIFVRGADENGVLQELMIEDRRSGGEPALWFAQRGILVENATTPAIILQDGSIQTAQENGQILFSDFESAPFQLNQFIEPPGQLLYKLSDRFAHELLFPNLTHYWEFENSGTMLAEGHARMAAPLYDLGIALIAVLAMLAGDFRRTGYARRIAAAALTALALRVSSFVVQAGAGQTPVLNVLQYALPAAVILAALALYFRRRGGRRRIAPGRIAPEMAVA